MTIPTNWKAPLVALLAGGALFSASPALAQDTDTQNARATATYNEALDAGKNGQYATACRGFKNAAIMYENAIGSLYSHSMATDEDRDYVKQYAKILQDRADSAKEVAKVTCGLDDGPPPSSAGSDSESSDGVDYDFAKKEDLQEAVQLATNQYREADRLYDAHDFAGACASARLSADGFIKAAATLKGNRALESAFANADQIYANAEQVAHDRDVYFCAKSS